MRLRQAHAILIAITALEAAFPTQVTASPTDHDDPNSLLNFDEDLYSGVVECNDPDNPRFGTRVYSFALTPGPGTFDITLGVWEGWPWLHPPVFTKEFTVWRHDPNHDDIELTDKPGQLIAETITAKVREFEAPHVAAYNARAARG